MASKRTWHDANGTGANTSVSPNSRPRLSETAAENPAPSISRKVKACAACRKQKIKCIMDDSGPPCKRCTERKLSCVLNKSLQTLIEERSEWKHTVTGDLVHLHTALQQVLGQLSLPHLPPLQTSASEPIEPPPQDETPDQMEGGPSCDNSPRVSPQEDNTMPHVPIESLYQITRLRSLRADDNAEAPQPSPSNSFNHPVNDFISNGLVSIEDAERLVNFFLNRIGHFMYVVGTAKYRDLDSLRRGSQILTACVCTVAALHDPMSNHLYGVCNREFRRLLAASMFDRRIDRDHLRALCIATYWLHDVSWTLSGYAIRRATEVNLSSNYHRVVVNQSEDALDCVRIWWILYICDHHLSILYGRPSIVRQDAAISGWKELMGLPNFTESDKRLVSQMELLGIMSNARELFGPDTGEPVPKAFAPQLVNFSRQIDHWMGYWTTEVLRVHPFIGGFPPKGIILHHHLAKLHLHSHVFRGLKGGQIPAYFQESAATAVTAATSIIETVLTDHDIREALVGIPHYIHSMIAFACVFLLKIAAQYSERYIEDTVVYDLTTKAVQQFRSTAVSKWHLVHLMANGLEKMIARKNQSPSAMPPGSYPNGVAQPGTQYVPDASALLPGMTNGIGLHGVPLPPGSGFEDDWNLTTTPFLNFDSAEFDFNFAL